MSEKIGYARISTIDQNLNLQLDALEQEGCTKIFQDTISGSRSDRPGFEDFLSYVRPGDTLVVWKLDRLGRTMKFLVNLINEFEKKDIQFKSITEGIDTNTTIGKFTFNIFGSLAQFERDMIRERSLAGQKAARSRGERTGRPKKLEIRKRKFAKELYESNKYPIQTICKMLEITKPTLYRYIREE